MDCDERWAGHRFTDICGIYYTDLGHINAPLVSGCIWQFCNFYCSDLKQWPKFGVECTEYALFMGCESLNLAKYGKIKAGLMPFGSRFANVCKLS